MKGWWSHCYLPPNQWKSLLKQWWNLDVPRLWSDGIELFFTSLFEFDVDHELMGDLNTAFMLWEHEMMPTISEHQREIALSASKALLYVMAEGHVPYDFFNTLPIKVRLVPDHYYALRGFLEYAKNLYSEGHIRNVETRCSTFLFWAQVNGICQTWERLWRWMKKKSSRCGKRILTRKWSSADCGNKSSLSEHFILRFVSN